MKATLRLLFFALCLLLAPLGLSAQKLVFHECGGVETVITLPADMHIEASSGVVTFTSGSKSVDIALGSVLAVTFRGKTGDVNEDRTVDVADIATIIDIMAGKGGDDTPGTDTGKAPAGVVAVDLGLPSGTKWANMNVGAEKPEDYGLFFAWGETTGYTSDTSDGRLFDWASYKWMNTGLSFWTQVNKYQVADGQTSACWYDSNGNFIGDRKSTLELADDAARANWGGQWVMPTYDDMRELLDNTTSEWTTLNGVNGRKFTSKTNGNSIFLPAAGWRGGSSLDYQAQSGDYWSSSVNPSNSGNARYLGFYSGNAGTYSNDRVYGFSVRPVLRN